MYICSCNEFRIFLYHKLFQIILHLYHQFEWIYLIVNPYVATLNGMEIDGKVTYFVGL